MNTKDAIAQRKAPLKTPTALGADATQDISGALNILLADMFALYMKTKNFHWHVSGPHFRDYHLLLDEEAGQIYATTDAIAERVRKIGGTTLRSIGQIGRLQRVLDNDADFVTPLDIWESCATTTCNLQRICARRTASATSTAMSRRRASWRTGSTRLNSVSGFCSRRAGAVMPREAETPDAGPRGWND